MYSFFFFFLIFFVCFREGENTSAGGAGEGKGQADSRLSTGARGMSPSHNAETRS